MQESVRRLRVGESKRWFILNLRQSIDMYLGEVRSKVSLSHNENTRMPPHRGLTEIAGLHIDGRVRRGGHCRTGQWRTGH